VVLSTGSRARFDLAMTDEADTRSVAVTDPVPSDGTNFGTDAAMREREKANLVAALRHANRRVRGTIEAYLSPRAGHKAHLRGKDASVPTRLRARFECSVLPADGGHVLPHTDASSKIITLITSMLNEGEWNPGFGGGTDVNRVKDSRHSFTWLNAQGRFEDMEVLDTYRFTPNQGVVFIKTFNSWHSVCGPCRVPDHRPGA
jgi:hypothetical protein